MDGTWPVPRCITCESRVKEKCVGPHSTQGNPALPDALMVSTYFVFKLYKHQCNLKRRCIEEKGITAYAINRLNAVCYSVHNSAIPHHRKMYGRLRIVAGPGVGPGHDHQMEQ